MPQFYDKMITLEELKTITKEVETKGFFQDNDIEKLQDILNKLRMIQKAKVNETKDV